MSEITCVAQPHGDLASSAGRLVTFQGRPVTDADRARLPACRRGRPVPKSWSRQKRAGVHAAIRWSPRREEIASVRLDAMSGRRLLELRDGGEARPYVLGHAAHQLATDTIATVTTEGRRVRAGLNRTELELIAWLAAVEIGFGMPGLSATHEGLAELLRVSKRTVGTHTRRLAAMGLIECHAQHAPRDGHECEGRNCRKGKHVRLWNLYALTEHVRALVRAERHAKRGGHRPCTPRSAPATAEQRADLLRAFAGESAPLASLRSGKKIQGEESQLPNGSCSEVSPVGERVDRAPEGAGRGFGAGNALAAVLAHAAREKAEFEAAVRAEFDARSAAVNASVPARVARALAAAAAGDAPGGDPELRELVRLGHARDVDDARGLVALVDDHPIKPCPSGLARTGLCCPVHAVRAALRGGAS